MVGVGRLLSESVGIKIQVRPNDLDSSGHVNNAVVLEYLEAGRWSWLKHHSLAGGKKIIPVVTWIEVNYNREILFGELTVSTKLKESDTPLYYQVVFEQLIEFSTNSSTTIAVQALVKVAFIDSVERTVRSVQDFMNNMES
jgi:YbgC/YbaW family acyl-CoA thioester hydrolase